MRVVGELPADEWNSAPADSRSARRGSAVRSHVDTDAAGYSAANYADSNATDDGPEYPTGRGCVVEFAGLLGR